VIMNLLSAKSIRAIGYSTEDGPDCSTRILDKNKDLAAIAVPKDGVYTIEVSTRPVFSITTPDPLYRWHLRFGHANYKSVSQVTGVPFSPRMKPPACFPCLAGKQTRKRSMEPQKRAEAPLDFIHCDLGGGYERSPSGYQYFLVFVDDYSRYVWVWFLKSKDKVACSAAIKEFKHFAENQFGRKIKRMRTDNGSGEFANTEWDWIISEAGIQHEPAPPYHKDRNGVSERMIRTLKEMATSMLAQAGLPPRYWSEAVNTATHLRNRLISNASLTGMTAYFRLYPQGKEDQISHLKPFGCLCFAGVPEEQQKSFTSKTRVCLLMGYGPNSTSIYKVMDVKTKRVFHTPTVSFDEEIFPGLPSATSNPNLFPYRNETLVDRIPEQLADGSALPPFESGMDSGNKEPKGREKRKNAPIDNDYSSRLRKRTRTQGESQRDLAIGRSKDQRKSLSRELSTGISQSHGLAMKEKGPIRELAIPNSYRNFEIVIPAYKSPSELASANTDHPDVERRVSFINMVSGLTYADLAEDELSTRDTYFWEIGDKPIPTSSCATTMVAQPRRKITGPGGYGAGLVANIRVDVNGDPLDFSSAMRQNYTNWYPAIQSELKSLLDTKCFEITFLPPGRTAIGCRWVFKRKMESKPIGEDSLEHSSASEGDGYSLIPVKDRIHTRYKARLVAKGFEQQYGIDYWNTSSPTPRITTFRLLVALASFFKWEIHQVDVVTAFLNAPLDVETYMKIPDGMEDIVHSFLKSKGLTRGTLGDNVLSLRLLKSLYGLKQSPLEWYKNIDAKLRKLGFRQCDTDRNLYIPTFENGCLLLLHVDDILLVGPKQGIAYVKSMIFKLYKMKDMGRASLYLGVEITHLPGGAIKLSQTSYIEKTLERFGLSNCNGVKLPMKKDLQESSDDLLSPEETKEYQSIVGALNWGSVVTRPDISYTVSRLSRFLSKPARTHKEAAKHCLRYLAGTKDLGLIYGTEKSLGIQLFGYTDSNFAADTSNRRSTSGYLFILNGACIHWQSKQQSLVTRSTHEAEYVGMATASYEISYLRRLLADVSNTPIHNLDPTLLYGDNLGAIDTATNLNNTKRSRHIDIRYHITREALSNGILRLQYCRTNDMVADILTKPLPIGTHESHCISMGLGR
jgi:Reverse transcriptase (RNA-dependent DNA polymerase)/Integrase core domain